MGKLDAAPTGAVNGPEGSPLFDWQDIDWSVEEGNVRRLRQRIFKASQEGDLKRVRSLQKLMLRSRSNALVSVRRVTQQSTGRQTAGVDGKVVLTPAGRTRLRPTEEMAHPPPTALQPTPRCQQRPRHPHPQPPHRMK